jgi:ribonuclease HII
VRTTDRPQLLRSDPGNAVNPTGPRRGSSYASLFAASGRADVPAGLQERRDPDWAEERFLWRRGHRFVAGIDEVGRGCLAGPVVAAAVILPRGWAPTGLRDSKLLDPPTRERLAAEIRQRAVAWAVASVEVGVIDATDILQATILASMLAAARLSVRPDALLLDAMRLPGFDVDQRALPRADRLCVSVAAASVVAKVARDAMMVELDLRYPGYGFSDHKGYASPDHIAALERIGASPAHRRSFARCAEASDADQLALWGAPAD